MPTIIAIDPGKIGGIACRSKDGTVTAHTMPDTHGGVCDLLRSYAAQDPNTIAVLEKVGGYVAGNPAPGSAMFNFGEGYGFVQGVLLALGVRTELISPQKWQASLGIGTRGKREQRAWKTRLKEEAQRLYAAHDVKVTNATCDALLILEYRLKQPY